MSAAHRQQHASLASVAILLASLSFGSATSAAGGDGAKSTRSGTVRLGAPALSAALQSGVATRGSSASAVVSDPAGRKIEDGTLTLEGGARAPSGPLGDIVWERDGKNLTGTVKDANGSTVVSFVGQATAAGARGTYRAADGSTGGWDWKPKQ